MAAMRNGPLARQAAPAGPDEPGLLGRLAARQLVTDEILVAEAEAAGLVAPSARDRTADVVAFTTLIASLVERVTAGATVPEVDVFAFYERNRDRYEIPESRTIRHILVVDEATAYWLVARLRDGDAFARLARDHSIDAGSRDSGGDLGEVRRGVLPQSLEEAIFGADVGTIVGPIQTEHGWHIARVEAASGFRRAPYEEVRASIETELLARERERVFDEWLEQRRAELATVTTESAHWGDPMGGAPSHRH